MGKKNLIIAGLWLVGIMLAAGAYHWLGQPPPHRWEVGAYYSVIGEKGRFQIAKVLALDPGIVSVRIYKETFVSRPTSVDTSSLSLGSIHDKDGFGMGHIPVSESTFAAWEPQFLLRGSVGEEELEGYKIWNESGGGAWE